MQYTVEKQSGNQIKITFTASADEFEAAVGKAYLKNRGRINVPGFRKGKAPRKLIERMFGETVFHEDALEMLFPDAYMEAVQKEDLHPVSSPDLHVDSVEKGQDVVFHCEVYVQPDVKLGAYKGVAVTRKVSAVPQSDVDERLTQERKRVARSLDVTDRPVEMGDEVNLDYSGSVDGVKFDGGTAQGQKLLIGSGSFIPGFEEQLVGLAVGEEKDVNVTFPEEYHAEALKGKAAVFHVKVNSITREELPELDDDFANEVSDFDTLAAFSADIRAKLQATADERATETAKQSLVQAVVDAAEVDIPAPMVEEKLNDLLHEMDWRMQQQGFDMKKYLQITRQSEAQMRDMYRGEARNNLKTELVIEEIIKAEGVEADEAAVDALVKQYAEAYGKTAEEFKAEAGDSRLTYFAHRAKIDKTLDMLWDSAVVTDEAADQPKAEPAEAKPAAKKASARKAAEALTADADETPKAPKAKAPARKKEKAAPEGEGAQG